MSSLRFVSTVSIVGASLMMSVACTQPTSESKDNSHSALVGPDHDPPVIPRVAVVALNGTGCPDESTWETEIARDGQSVIMRLHAFDARVTAGEAFSIRDCTMSLKIADGDGYRYALAAFVAAGWASLQGEGMRGEETVKYYVQGNPVANETRLREFSTGPGSRYEFGAQFAGDKVPADEETAVWSPCDGGRDLVIQSRKVLRNNTEKTGYGFIGGTAIHLQLAFRRCEAR